MASLPTVRVTPAPPFMISGVDFAGPFLIRRFPGRPLRNNSNVDEKVWIVVFVCLVTHAIHLDLTHGLSVEAFLETFARFTGRRGACQELWSDNGTTFVGTDNELKRVIAGWNEKLPHEHLANYGTTWRFITPGAPHQGGMWEAGVKAVKHHLRRTIGAQKLTSNQMYTILTRPIVPISQDGNDLEALTPGHFLIGRPLLQPPLTEELLSCPDNRLTAWGRQQKLVQSFWQRWKEEHLLTLQARAKWHTTNKNLRVGDIVIILSENTPPSDWPLGRVTAVHPGKDELVRNVDIRTATTTLTRPIQKIVPLHQPEERSICERPIATRSE